MRPVYISYPETEYDFAHQLVDDLQAAGYVVFVDAVGAPGSPAWAAETRRAIRLSGALVMILSPEDGRRIGTRHEGVLALRGNKPFVVIQRTPGDLPRYAQQGGVTVIDGTGEYGAVLRGVLTGLPSVEALLQPTTPAPRPPTRPPRPPQVARRRRYVLIVMVVAAAAVCLGLGVVLGVIPV